jgi:hypothetical protein
MSFRSVALKRAFAACAAAAITSASQAQTLNLNNANQIVNGTYSVVNATKSIIEVTGGLTVTDNFNASYQNPNAISYGGDTITVDSGASFNAANAEIGLLSNLLVNGTPYAEAGTSAIFNNYGTTTFSSTAGGGTYIDYDQFTNFAGGILNADGLTLLGDGNITNAGNINVTGNLSIFGNSNDVANWTSVLNNTNSVVVGGTLTIAEYGILNTNGVKATAQLNNVTLGAGLTTSITYQNGTVTPNIPTELEATNGGTINVGTLGTPAATFNNGTAPAVFYPTGQAGQGSGGIVNADGSGALAGGGTQASSITINANAVANLVEQNWIAQQPNVVMSATNGGNLTLNAQTILDQVTSAGVYYRDGQGTYVFGILNEDFVTPNNAYMFADGAGSQLNLNASTSLTLNQNIIYGYPYGESTTNPVYLEPNIPAPYINATNGGTVNITTPTLFAGGGGFTASGAGSSINVSAHTINLGSGFTAENGAKVEIGSAANPIDMIQSWIYSGGFTSGGVGTLPPAEVDVYATHYNTPPLTKFAGGLVAYTGSVLNVTGQTLLTGELYASWNGYTAAPPSAPIAQININESDSVTGPGLFQAYYGDITVKSPIINYSTSGVDVANGTVLLDGYNSVTMTNGGPFSAEYPSYGSIAGSVIAQGGTFDAVSPNITFGDGVSPIGFSVNGPESLVFLQATNALGSPIPGGTVSLEGVTNYQGVYAQSGFAAYNGGVIDLLASSVTIDGTSNLQIGQSAYFYGGTAATSYLLANNIDASGLDFQNSGVLATSANGSIVVGGSTFENEGSGVVTVGSNTTSYLGYTEGFTAGLPNVTPSANATALATSNSGSLNVYGTLNSNGSISNSGFLTVSDSGLDLQDAPSNEYNPTQGPYLYRPASVEVFSGDLTNTGNALVIGSTLTVDTGNIRNSGSFAVTDDLTDAIYMAPLNSSVNVVTGDFHNNVSTTLTPSVVTVTGSSFNVGGTLYNDSSFSVSDDSTGGTSYTGTPPVATPNNYPVQYSTFTAGGIHNTGLFNSDETTLTVGALGLNNSGTFNAFADDTLLTPLGSSINIAEGTLTNSGTMQLVGSTVTIGTGITPAGNGLENQGGTLSLLNDYTAYTAGTAPTPLLGSITVGSGDVRNGGGVVNLTGTTLNILNGNLINDGGALNVTSDLAAPAALGVVQGSLQINGDLDVTDGTVTVQGSSIAVGGNIYVGATGSPQTGSFVITDDSLGNLSSFTPYYAGLPSPNIVVSGAGSFQSTETTVSAGSLTNQDNGTFLVQDDQKLAQPVGSALFGSSLSNLGAAQFTVTGSQVYVGNGVTNSGSAGALKGATITIGNDDTPAVSGTGSVVVGALNVYSGDFNNLVNANLNINGGALVMYNGDVHNSGASHIDIEADSVGNGGGLQSNNFVNSNYGVVNIATNASYGYSGIYTGTNFTNQDRGVVTIGQTGSLYVQGLVTNGSTTGDAAKIYNYGYMTLGSQGLFQTGSGSVLKDYGFINTSGASSSITLGNVGDAAGSAGTLGGNGTIGYIGHPINVFNNAGTVNPGDPQILTIVGNYTQGANGTIILNVDGPGGAGVGYDQLNVTGNLILDGTIDIVFGDIPGTTTPYTPTGLLDLINYSGTYSSLSTLKFEETIDGTTTQGLTGGYTVGILHTAAVPEPSSFAAFGAAGLGFLLRRRKAKATA